MSTSTAPAAPTLADRKRARSAHQPAGQWNGSRWITRERRLAIYLRDGFTCQYCQRDLHGATPAEIHLDHKVCRSAGGANESDNLVTACRRCNCQRGARTWQAYAATIDGDDPARPCYWRVRSATRRRVNVELARAIIAGTAS